MLAPLAINHSVHYHQGMQNVVIIGMKHCGKSTVGALLADRWNCPFRDVDRMIESLHACDTGERITVRELLSTHGEDHFHYLEEIVICDLYMKLQKDDARMVVAVGGRTALNDGARKLLDGLGTRVYLEVSRHELWRRVCSTGIPPWLDPVAPEADFYRLHREREPEYRAIADLTIPADGLTPGQVAEQIEQQLREPA